MDARQIAALVLLSAFGATAGGVSLTACSADGPAPGATRPTSGETDLDEDEEDTDEDGSTATPNADAGAARPSRPDGRDGGRPSRDAGACPEDASVRPFVREAGVGVYCRRSLDGGRHGNCAPGQACVFTARNSTANGACVEAPATTPGGGIVYACQGPQDCTGGQVCCTQGGGVEKDRCGALRAQSRFSGARCQASCGATEAELCEVDGTCSDGKTCVGFTAYSTRLGTCTE
jgi:hypothetical protein